MVVDRNTGETFDDRYELVDVELYIQLGMTPKEARCFARFLDDECPAGFGSGRLASLITKRLERAERLKLNAQTQARAMISKFQEGYMKLPFRD
jgi:hypothetical protein